MSRTGEFAAIAAHFRPLAKATPAARNLADDAALLATSPDQDLVLTTDALVAGVHFMMDHGAEAIAAKGLRVNLSDLAAMGAEPVGYLLAVSLPDSIDDDWLAAFARSLARDQERFAIGLLGGDTTRTPGPLTIVITAIGRVANGTALRRNGARLGDRLYVSGTIGDAGLALHIGKDERFEPIWRQALNERLLHPTPRLALGLGLRGLATAALDISDGLIADIDHICSESGVGAVVERDAVPLSDAARQCLSRSADLWPAIVSGGDDYELAFTIPPARAGEVALLSEKLGLALTEIGLLVAGDRTRITDAAGREITQKSRGYRHF